MFDTGAHEAFCAPTADTADTEKDDALLKYMEHQFFAKKAELSVENGSVRKCRIYHRVVQVKFSNKYNLVEIFVPDEKPRKL